MVDDFSGGAGSARAVDEVFKVAPVLHKPRCPVEASQVSPRCSV